MRHSLSRLDAKPNETIAEMFIGIGVLALLMALLAAIVGGTALIISGVAQWNTFLGVEESILIGIALWIGALLIIVLWEVLGRRRT